MDENKLQWQQDSDGSMVAYNDAFSTVTHADTIEAERVENEIFEHLGRIETSYLVLGKLLSDFKEKKLYLAAGDTSFQVWAESPRLSRIGYRSAMRLIQIVNEALPILEKNGAIELIPKLGMSTMSDLLPILNDENGEEKFVEAAMRVQDMTNRDAKMEVKALRGQEDTKVHGGQTVFKAKVRQGEDYHRVEIHAANENDYYKLGLLSIKRRDWARFEKAFGVFVQFEDE